MNSEGMAERVRPWPQEQRCVHLGDKGMVSDGVESFCEVQGNEVDIVIVLKKTCDLVQKINYRADVVEPVGLKANWSQNECE